MWLTPRRGWWLGLALALIGLIGSNLLITAAFAIGGQELASSFVVWVLIGVLGAAVPMGAAFLVTSIVAARIRHGWQWETQDAVRSADSGRIPPRPNARVAVLLGFGFLLAGLIVDASLLQPPQTTGQFPTVENDVLSILVTLSALLTPIGVALVPGGWLLAHLETRTGTTSDADPSGTPSSQPRGAVEH